MGVINMNDKDIERLSLDDFDEDDFMLNDSHKNTDLSDMFIEDNTTTYDTIDYEEELAKLSIPPREDKEVTKTRSEISESRKEEPKKVEKKEKPMKKKKVKTNKKVVKDTAYYIRFGFVVASAVFVLGCCIFYGTRMIKYYRMFHPKATNGQTVTLIKEAILGESPYQTEGEGLYRVGGASVYKGIQVDNYFKYSGLLWRIVSINVDGTIDLVLNEPINTLYYSDKNVLYDASDIRSYLNKKFINNIDNKYLAPASFCADTYEDVPSSACKTYITDDKVRLLTVSEFVNTVVDEGTFINTTGDLLWLTEADTKNNWIINGTNISTSKPTNPYYVKPVIRIARTATLGGGKGTQDDPYYIEKDKEELTIGKYVKLGTDVWSIYEVNEDNIRLALSTNLNKHERFSTKTNKFSSTDTTGMYYYLNNTYYNLLSYKDKLLETDWYIGSYEGKYESCSSESVKAKVGLLNIADLKLNMADSNYYLLTPTKNNAVFYYQDGLITAKISLARAIRPAISIKKESITSGTGTLDDPYELGGAA